MDVYYDGLTLFQKVFAICAVVGGTVFVLRTLMLFIGISHDVGLDGATDVHVGLNDSDVSFHFLTIHGITAFFLMFGVVGLTISKYYAISQWLALAGAAAAGLITMWLIAKIFSSMVRLQSDGTVRMANAVGQEGVVYLNIPVDGIGKVQITIQGGLRIFEARARSQEKLKTGDRVKVLEVTPENMVIVEKMNT
jgi:membrane protein implicated in regulation of membrane protease activity